MNDCVRQSDRDSQYPASLRRPWVFPRELHLDGLAAAEAIFRSHIEDSSFCDGIGLQ